MFCLIILAFAFNLYSQREANIWYFGTYAGLDFNSGHPVPLLDGQINRWEGVASISDSLGNILIYTDGDSVWNANHTHMPNGYDLLGEPSSTESAIIIPYPDNDSLYIIFTVDAEGGEDGLCYSVVNMNLDNGLGDIQTKNIKLTSPVSEKVTAVRHANNRDFWVVSHGWDTDSFFVYLVTPSGVDPIPQIFELGTPHYDIGLHGNNAVGYMKFSPDGTKIAAAIQVSMVIELYDFDNSTGLISNPITINAGGSPYGVEFSSDVSKLYYTSQFYLFQADLSSYNETDIVNSVTLIDSSQTFNFFGAIQLATDGKIYLSQEFSPYIGIVNNPTKPADSCDFVLNGLYLKGRSCRMGLPDFIQTYFLPPDFKTKFYCFGDSTIFYLTDTTGIDSVLWNFGEISSLENTSKEFFPKHKYASSGKYQVIVKMWRSGIEYSKKRIIQINQLPQFNGLGNDTTICSGDSILLDAITPDCSYLWDNLSTDSVLWANIEKLFIVTVKDNYTECSTTDSINIKIAQLPDFSLGQDTGFCKFDSIKLYVNYPNAIFNWNTGHTDSLIYVNTSGTYILQITDSLNCKSSDTIEIVEYQLPDFSLGQDTNICPNTLIYLSPGTYSEYLWNDSTNLSFLSVEKEGTYWVEVSDVNKCKYRDSINIFQLYYPDINFPEDTVICNNNRLILKYDFNNTEFLWNDNSRNFYLEVIDEGEYWLRATNICGEDIDSINVIFKYCEEPYIPNIFTPNDDGVNEYFKIKGIENDIWGIKIYNRLGSLVFSADDYKNNWDGGNCPDGTYYYILFNTEQNIKYNGTVRIYR